MMAAMDLLPAGAREGYADLREVRLHYVEMGEGPLVVLLHGFPEFWYGWRHQIPGVPASGDPGGPPGAGTASSRRTCAATPARRSRAASPPTTLNGCRATSASSCASGARSA